jgi:protein JSN1
MGDTGVFIECVQSPEEIALIVQNSRAYALWSLLDQYRNYVVQYVTCRHCALLTPDRFNRCYLRLGAPANDFICYTIVSRACFQAWLH